MTENLIVSCLFDFAIIRLSFFFLVFLVARCHWTQTPKNVCAWIKIRILASLTGTCKNCKMTAYAYKLDWYLWISIFIIFPEYDFCLSLVHQILNFHWIELTFLPMESSRTNNFLWTLSNQSDLHSVDWQRSDPSTNC